MTTGVVTTVGPQHFGGTLAATTAAGDMVLQLDDAGDFAEEVDFDEGSCWLVIGDSPPLQYVASDEDADTITLAGPVGAVYEAGLPVRMWDATIPPDGGEVVEFEAHVLLDVGEPEDPPIPAVVPDTLIPYADVDDLQALVGARVRLVQEDEDDPDDEWQIAEVLGRAPSSSGAYVADGSLPVSTIADPENLPLPDTDPTEPPAVSPSLTVTGTTNGLVVRADEVDADTLIQYHITATPPTNPDGDPLDFTPTPDTALGEPTRTTVLVVTELPDGNPLTLDTTYYLRAVASNVVGEAPPGPQAAGQLDTSTLSEVIANTVTAGFFLAGSIQVGQITIDADGGITIPTEAGGIHFPADGSAAIFSGDVVASSVQVENHLTINGEQNRINGQLILNNVVEPPNVAPTLGDAWVDEGTIGADVWSLTDSQDGTEWVTIYWNNGELRAYNKATGALTRSQAHSRWSHRGVTRIGGWFYTIANDRDNNNYVNIVQVRQDLSVAKAWPVISVDYTPATPAIGTAGSEVVTAWVRDDGKVRIRHYDPATTEQVTTSLHTFHDRPVALNNIGFQFHGDTGDVYWLGYNNYIYRLPVGAVGALVSRAGEAIKGLHYDGTRMRTLGYNSYKIWRWGTEPWSAPVSVRFSWYDSDPGGTGVHETQAGPAADFKPEPYSFLSIRTPAPADTGAPDAPDQTRLYVDDKLHGVGVVGGVRLIESINPVGDPPPMVNGFIGASATPGSLTSAAVSGTGETSRPLIDLQGDGSGRAGPLTWDETGRGTLELSANARIRKTNATQNIPDRSTITITYQTVDESSPAGFADTTNNRLSIPDPGLYLVTAVCRADVGSAGNVGSAYFSVRVNGNEMMSARPPYDGGNASATITGMLRLVVGDHITVHIFSNSGAAVSTTTLGTSNSLTAAKIGK